MKKLFVSIVALAAFVACQSNFEDVTTNTPGIGGDAVPEGLVKVYAEVGVGEETKATYGEDLSALWEENDQIALVQESAANNSAFNHVNALDIKRGAGTNSAAFWGDITVPTESPRIYHIAYPVSAVSFNVANTVTKVSDSSYATKETTYGMAHYAATANYKYEYTTTLNVAVPTVQSGKWEPYMYASTPEAVSANGIRATKLQTLTGAIAISAYEADGKTPKKLSEIAVSSTNSAIAGAFTGSAVSSATISVTGDYTKDDYSTMSDVDVGPLLPGKIKGKAEADKLLEERAKSTVPTTSGTTQSMSLAFAGTEKTVGATNLANIGTDSKGNYVYYLNVVPVADETLTIVVKAEDGSTLVRQIKGVNIAASQRIKCNVKWESATLTAGGVETWYDDYSTDASFNLEGSKVYAKNLKVEGVQADAVKELGVIVQNANGDVVAQNISANNTLSLAEVSVDVPTSGKYTAYAYAKIIVNGQEQIKTAGMESVSVTPVLTNAIKVRSSYSTNGGVNLDNSIWGDKMIILAATSDSWATKNLVKSATYSYTGKGTSSGTLTAGDEKQFTFAYSAWGQYNCYVKIEMTNGLVFDGTYATHVTGIPYTLNTSSNDGSWAEESSGINWNTAGGVRLGVNRGAGVVCSITKSFHIPANVTVKVTANGIHNGTGSGLFAVENKVTLTVGATKVVEQTQKGNTEKNFSCNAASASMSSSNNTVKCHSSYNMAAAKVVVKALHIEF